MSRTQAASKTSAMRGSVDGLRVVRSRRLLVQGWTPQDIRSQLDAGRWQRVGRALVLHNDEPSRHDVFEVARLNASPRALWTAFTAAEIHGLRGWQREPVHLLVPPGVPVTYRPVPIRVHRGVPVAAVGQCVGHWAGQCVGHWAGHCEVLPSALIRAASSLDSARSACGVIAAAVQQRLVRAADLDGVLLLRSRTRHRAVLRHAIADIAQGSEALSEIDFARLCRAHGLPMPLRQAVRNERSGRRRYVDAEWQRSDGRRVVVEIDGALHLAARRWWGDQLRQNELVLGGAIVLRFPSVVLRTEPAVVVEHLRRALELVSTSGL
ncbi:MAG TPA: hypothetical protein VGH11_08940 [Jatrophihabitans sp.]|jgi:hypothetical protein